MGSGTRPRLQAVAAGLGISAEPVAPLQAAAAATATAAAIAAAAAAPQSQQRRRPLSAEQLREFVTHGGIVLHPELPPAAHAATAAKLRSTLLNPPLSDREFWESLPLTPETNALLRDPVVAGALETLLGDALLVEVGQCGTATVHSHGSVEPGTEPSPNDDCRFDQEYHMDSSWRAWRDWRPRHLLMFYYPSGATLAQGPTALCPGSQYYRPYQSAAASGFPDGVAEASYPDLAERDALLLSAGARHLSGGARPQPWPSSSPLFEEQQVNTSSGGFGTQALQQIVESPRYAAVYSAKKGTERRFLCVGEKRSCCCRLVH